MDEVAVPKCGESDKRNTEYETNYSPEKLFHSVVDNPNPVIFDVGAHKGESIKFFKNIFKSARIFSFEPSPVNFEELKLVASVYQTNAVNVAIGESVGEVKFYQQSLSHLGGLLPINEKSKDSLGYAEKAQNVEVLVDCITLNEALNRLNIISIDILKIDVQGFEVGVLKGGSEALSKTKMVMIEVSLYDFYGESKNTWFDVNKILGEAGFELFDIAKISKNPKNLRTDWVELIFTKHQ
jgi:FkbM family methyltransferase